MAEIKPTADRPAFQVRDDCDDLHASQLLRKFADRVDVGGDGCWEWRGAKNKFGYAKVSHLGRVVGLHRLIYFFCVGDLTPGLFVCHRCDNPGCCNPAHLFGGTHADNMADMKTKGRAARTPNHGEANGRCLLDAALVLRARSLAEQVGCRSASRQLAEETGHSEATIRQAIRRVTWRHL